MLILGPESPLGALQSLERAQDAAFGSRLEHSLPLPGDPELLRARTADRGRRPAPMTGGRDGEIDIFA